MSSKEAEFIAQWNGILDYKIDEQNLRRPNFQFFYNALESLLRKLNFNIEAAKSEVSNCNDGERMYYIKFCGFVHRLYQLSDGSFNFYYFDLIHPTPKKSFHVLKMLFNYLKYYEMVKETVCEKASDALSSYNDALAINNALQVKNETAKKRAANMEVQLAEYQKKLPEIQDRVNQCSAEVQRIEQEITQKSAHMKNYDSTFIKLGIKHTELCAEIVNESDYKERIDNISALKQELIELRSVAEHVRSSNVCSSAKINELTNILDVISNSLKKQQLSHYEDFKTLDANGDALSKDIQLQEHQIKELSTNIKALTENTEKILSKSAQITTNTDKVMQDTNGISDELVRTLAVHEQNIEQASSELSSLKSSISELEQQQFFIVASISKILHVMTSTKLI